MPKKILVIDDEELIVRSLAKLLEKTGFEVFMIKQGRDAVAMAEEEDFDMVISDVRMPGTNGIETVRGIFQALKQRAAPFFPAVVFITGYADAALEAEAKKLDPVAYVYKPFDMAELTGIIQKALA
jgi:CheY-like chemotaxis protein